MEELKKMAAMASIKKMFDQQWINICDIDKMIKMLVVVPDQDAYQILSTIHCVNFKEMPAALRDSLPELVGRVLSMPAPLPPLFTAADPEAATRTPDGATGSRRGLLSLIRGREE